MVTGDAALELWGVGALMEHGLVVVGFEDEAVEAIEVFEQMAGNAAGVGQYAQAEAGMAKAELARFAGVMGYGKGRDLYVADAKAGLVGMKEVQVLNLAKTGTLPSAVGGPERDAMAAAQAAGASDVVAVLVAEQQGVDRFRGEAKLFQAPLKLLE